MSKLIGFLLLMFFSIQCVFGAENHLLEKKQAKSKQKATKFLYAVANDKNFAEASKYLGLEYIQHSPSAADGISGLQQYIKYLRDKQPQHHNKIMHIFADGNFVILYVLSTNHPDDRGDATIDIFRFKNGKIVEHWDVVQPIPEKASNSNGMF